MVMAVEDGAGERRHDEAASLVSRLRCCAAVVSSTKQNCTHCMFLVDEYDGEGDCRLTSEVS